ncbi:dihydrolipoamide acetyltransferase family protein [Deinococcus roseus]|uniref:Dihydrolipoamide acetyltransferase component of pyruvate dehydrogenase complex n=1 Tax=Deinococcus roseus TaxID=392414 RepID=A0ABQ2D2H6_9DEIO|nr:dihydrolipoamide acetyltransferase family protein [Deinococcus roseus]GGJ37406.1 dihydrolipoamide acetyltransferase component of pyruvate dehydrogenase complex [Deinococcus roseus]
MSKEIRLPELAESVVEGEILRWMVEVGEKIEKDQPYIEVMTDKVTVELPSPISGVLQSQLVKVGDIVPVHAPIAIIAEEGEDTSAQPVATPAQVDSLQEHKEDTGDELSLFKAFGEAEKVKMPDSIRQPSAALKQNEAQKSVPQTSVHGRALAVPAARQLARELELDINEVKGSGPNGRIRVIDVHKHAESLKPATGGGAPSHFPSPVQYRTPRGYEDRETRVPLRGLRRAISQQMQASHLYTVRTLTVDETNLTSLVQLREKLKPHLEKDGVKLSYLPFIFKAIVAALKKFPSLNTSFDEARQEIVQKHYYNMGMAVSTDAGLVVPVIRDVDKKTVLEMAQEIQEVAEQARSGKLSPDRMAGSTFSITNIGSIGALFSFPIINVPDAAIMGIHTIQKRPIVNAQDEIVVAHMMYLSLSFDHRLVDGAEAARFCKEVIRLLETPELLVLNA